MHLIIDGHGCDEAQLSDPEHVRSFLNEYPASISMTKIIDPSVHIYRGPKPEDWGVSGFVIIAESHISIHTFPARGYINIDVFSCKEFDVDQALEEVGQRFAMGSARHWVLDRGLEHLDPSSAQEIVSLERDQLAAELS